MSLSKIKLNLLWILFLLSSAQLSAQIPRNAAPQPQSSSQSTASGEDATKKPVTQQAPKPFATQIKKTVVFLTVYCQDGEQIAKVQGTGFFVFVPDKRLGDGGFPYLVTNRHVAEGMRDDGTKRQVLSTTVRLNLKQEIAGMQSEEGALAFTSTLHWYFPKDDGVDLAVLPIAPDANKYDFETVPTSFFATPEVITTTGIIEGDPVMFAGFFYQYPGQKKIEPIIRQGILAMMPDEKLTTTLRRPGDIYLVDAHVFGGNSGSPIFVNTSPVGLGTYKLLGVVSGHYSESEDLKLEIATTLNGKLDANSGISLVVPAKELETLLNSSDLQVMRDSEVGKLQAAITGK